jgi:ABC-type Fe3+/spermidine/putrescine transport system ATPase subunit
MNRASMRFERVSFGYSVQKVISEIDLHIEPGELVVIVGPSGCGKSTLLRLVAGLLTPSEGRLLIDEQDVRAVPAHRRQIGWVPQGYALFDHLNVAQNIVFGLRMQQVARAEQQARLREMLDLCRIGELAERSVGDLSGGQRQRVAIARALAVRPRLLLLDEPLAALDPQLRLAIRSDLEDLLRRSGVTTLFVTHDQSEALALADRVAVLRAGRLEQFASPEVLWHSPVNAFVAEFVSAAAVLEARRISSTHVAIAPGLSIPLEGDAPTVCLALRPPDLIVDPTGYPAEVISCEYAGGMYLIGCRLNDRWVVRLYHECRVGAGEMLPVALKPHQKVVVLNA